MNDDPTAVAVRCQRSVVMMEVRCEGGDGGSGGDGGGGSGCKTIMEY